MHNSGFISSRNGSGQVEKERKKIYCFDPSCSTQNRKFQIKGKNIQKIKKHHSGFISSENGSGQVEKERKKNFSFRPLLLDPEQEFLKRRAKKFKKLKSTIQASFKAKTSRGGSRNREKKIIVPTVPTRLKIENSEKKEKKIQKIKKHHSDFISSQNGSGQVVNERKKNYRSDPSYPTQNRKFRKKWQKNSKN